MKKKIILGSSDTWSMSRLSQRPGDPAYYIEDCRISEVQDEQFHTFNNWLYVLQTPSKIKSNFVIKMSKPFNNFREINIGMRKTK